MCDCCGPVGDHDKPYQLGRMQEMRLRLTREEFRCLCYLRAHIKSVRGGYSHGPAFGDISADDPVCPCCGQLMHVHEPIGLCSAAP